MKFSTEEIYASQFTRLKGRHPKLLELKFAIDFHHVAHLLSLATLWVFISLAFAECSKEIQYQND
tara:strand:- start:136 stop:330 length:195 start_codon:yes stop_codon:yes gene_type:complete